jgi:hypothetical protein
MAPTPDDLTKYIEAAIKAVSDPRLVMGLLLLYFGWDRYRHRSRELELRERQTRAIERTEVRLDAIEQHIGAPPRQKRESA